MRNQTNGDLTKRRVRSTAALVLCWTVLAAKGYPAGRARSAAAPEPALAGPFATVSPQVPGSESPSVPAQEPSPAHPLNPAPSTPAPSGSVERIVSMRDHPASAPTTPHAKNYSITVPAGDWVDTGVTLAAGERVTFNATGTVTLADNRAVTPDGLDRGWKDLLRQFPLNSAKTGALVGRVSDMGASVPFSIGSEATVSMPTSGRLYLRANLTSDLGGTGAFTAKLTFPDASTSTPLTPSEALGAAASSRLATGDTAPVSATTSAATASVNSAVPVSTTVSPSLFTEIPRRVGDEAGNPGDMVNYALIGSEDQVRAAFKAAGWVAVDKNVGDALLHGLMATLNHEAYTEMPMSTLYLFGRPQDLSFARGDPLTVAAERHHLRVWKSPETVDGEPLWVGSATHDIGFEKDQRNGKATHKIDPNIDAERQFLLDSFDAAGVFSSAAYVTPANPLRDARTATGGSFRSDGRIVVMQLK